MDNQYLNPLKELNYADLSTDQQEKLKDFEKKFNTEFSTDFYFMVMKK